ncbi:MAG: ABC-2 type transport system permease protein [Sulfurimonas sp.]|jgi:ABC-2 type transport system permease protein
MKIRTVQGYVLKEFMELYRTKLIVMVYLLPVMVVILFGYGIRMEVTQARILIIDNDQSQLSRKVTTAFEHTKYFNAKTTYMSEKEAMRTIKQANTDVILIIPSSFEKNLYKGIKSEFGVFIDAAFPTRASTLEAYVQGEILNVASSVMENMTTNSKGTIELNSRSLFNQAMRDEDAIVPGLIGLVLLVAPAILAALLIVKEKEKGTIFNFYASPLSKGEFLLAKILPVFLLHSINIFILFLIAIYLFNVPFRGNFFLYWFSSELYIMISLSIGMLISVITKKQIVAVVLTVIVTILPGFLYSGILMPISSMSGGSYIEAHIFPVMYYNHILYDAFLIGQGLASDEILFYLCILTGFVIFFFTTGVLLLKKELK